MATINELEVTALDPDVAVGSNRHRVPQVGQTYELPRDVNITGNLTVTGTSPGSGDLKADGTVPLTANWDVGAFTIQGTQFISDIAIGTAPFVVTSTTVVANLNASFLEGNAASAFATAAHTILSHDTDTTGAELTSLADNSIVDSLHRHSELVASDGSPDPALSVDATGRVGIKTASPDAKLHVVGDSGVFPLIIEDSSGHEALVVDRFGTIGLGGRAASGPFAPSQQSSTHIFTTLSFPLMLGRNIQNVTKEAYVVGTQYDFNGEEEGLVVLGTFSDSTNNRVFFGGGSAARNAATSIGFFTAADISTRVGTERIHVDEDGEVTISTGNLIIGTAGKGIDMNGGPQILFGTATPEGTVTAAIGSMFMRSDGGANTSLYVKESGTGNTGWVGK